MFTAGVKLTDLDSNGRLLIIKLKHFASIHELNTKSGEYGTNLNMKK